MENETIIPEDKSQNVIGIIYTALSNFKKHFKRNPMEILMTSNKYVQFLEEIKAIKTISKDEHKIIFEGKPIMITITELPHKESFEIR